VASRASGPSAVPAAARVAVLGIALVVVGAITVAEGLDTAADV
jgi:hypothetical protein